MTAPVVRIARRDEAAELARIYTDAVRTLGAKDYTPAQIMPWEAIAPTAGDLENKMADGRARLVAVDGVDRPIGFIDVEPDGHIDLLYVSPRAAGRGAGRALLRAAECWVRDQAGKRLYAEASETARTVFERAGFRVLARRNFEVQGQPIHNWAVEKSV